MTGRHIPKKRKNPVKAIREFCIECMGGQAHLVKNCTTEVCALHDFRMGKNPFRAGPSEEQREESRKRALKNFHGVNGHVSTTEKSS